MLEVFSFFLETVRSVLFSLTWVFSSVYIEVISGNVLLGTLILSLLEELDKDLVDLVEDLEFLDLIANIFYYWLRIAYRH